MSAFKKRFHHSTCLYHGPVKLLLTYVILVLFLTGFQTVLSTTDVPSTPYVSLSTTINVYEDNDTESSTFQTAYVNSTEPAVTFNASESVNSTSDNRTEPLSNDSAVDDGSFRDSFSNDNETSANQNTTVVPSAVQTEQASDSSAELTTSAIDDGAETTTLIVTDVTRSRNSSTTVNTRPRHDQTESAGTTAGIVIGVLVFAILAVGIGIYLAYLHTKVKKAPPSVTSTTKFGDTCSYLDDTVRVSYINSHIELPKETSEEMTSLDNDSFLNSLEAMTIQNYWADNTKNTKV